MTERATGRDVYGAADGSRVSLTVDRVDFARVIACGRPTLKCFDRIFVDCTNMSVAFRAGGTVEISITVAPPNRSLSARNVTAELVAVPGGA